MSRPILLAMACILSAAPLMSVHAAESAAYTRCMERAGGVTSAMLDCGHREEERDDARLNAAYKRVMDAASPARRIAYRKAQRAWLAFRDAECEAAVDPDGGTLELLVRKGCRLDLIRARAEHFEAIAARN